MVALGDESAAKVVPWLNMHGATFPALLGQQTRREWNDPPGGNHALDVIVDRDGIVRTIDNGLPTEDAAAIVDELLAQ